MQNWLLKVIQQQLILTIEAIAGILLTDLILGRKNTWAELYDPSRVRIGGVGDFISENLNVAAQYL